MSTWNFNPNTFSPIHNTMIGPIADRPATAELHTVYLSTDEANGALTAYLYDGTTPWMKLNGIDGFTNGGGGGSGDYSTATVTTTGSSAIPAILPIIVDSPGYESLQILDGTSAGEELIVPLYKGKAIGLPMNVSISSFTVTGDIEIDENDNLIIITGDGTIEYIPPV